jgi:lysozyme
MLISVAVAATGILYYNGLFWFVYPDNLGYTVRGIDVSHHQGLINWQDIASQGIKFAFIKATEGSNYSDGMFVNNTELSKECGIYIGAYHYFSHESSGESQAENFINTVAAYHFDLHPVMDFEISQDAGDREVIINEALTFLNVLETHFKIKPIVYTTYESYNAFLKDHFAAYDFWIRDLFDEPNVKDMEWVFWQYCNRGRLDGINGKQKFVDLNVFNGDESEFNEYTGGTQKRDNTMVRQAAKK